MSKKEKLILKLKQGTIKASELKTLLQMFGWEKRVKSSGTSHEVWEKGSETFVLAVHRKELKRYQIKDSQKILL